MNSPRVFIEPLIEGGVVPELPPRPSESEIRESWAGKSKPEISIVCHAYNHEEFIEDALNGFLMQKTSFPFEIIVNDDASTDGTYKILKRYEKEYPSLIKILSHDENQFSKGICPSNFSFPIVRGKYIALCEGDDYWVSPEKLQLQLEAFEDGISLVFHDAVTLSERKFLSHSYYPDGKRPVKGYGATAMARGCRIPTASAVFLAEPFLNRERENIVNGDHLLWATLASSGVAKFLPRTMSAYRYHPGGIWSARQTLDKLESVVQSKLTIFSVVDRKFRSWVLLGMTLECIRLTKKLRVEGESLAASKFYRMVCMRVVRMIPYCDVKSTDSITCVLRSIYHLVINAHFLAEK